VSCSFGLALKIALSSLLSLNHNPCPTMKFSAKILETYTFVPKEKYTKFFIFLLLTLLNGVLVHFAGLDFLLITMLIFVFAALIICLYNYDLNPIGKCISLFILISIHDVITKLTGRGLHDSMGQDLGQPDILNLCCLDIRSLVDNGNF
jgi:hypothetical protein